MRTDGVPVTDGEMKALAAIAESPADVDDALRQVFAGTEALWGTRQVDLALFFASPHFTSNYAGLVQRVRETTGAKLLLGCSGQGIIGPGREAEEAPALSLLVASLPGAELWPAQFTQAQLARLESPEAVYAWTGIPPDGVNGWLVFADPFRLDCDALLEVLTAAYPGVPIVGGLASGNPDSQRTHVFSQDGVFGEGAVAVAIGGKLGLQTVVAQGATPIGQAWTITGVEANRITTIGAQPAYGLLLDTLQALPEEVRARVRRNLLVGLAMNEYQDTFGRGDFLVRNLLAVDPGSGAITVGALPRMGQTVQFQIRDTQAADEDLRERLAAAQRSLGTRQPVAALLCTCNGRGAGLFGTPDHDAQAIAAQLGPVPLAGFVCNGEIGPVGERSFLHGYTASVALLVELLADS